MREHAAQLARADLVAPHLPPEDRLDLTIKTFNWYVAQSEAGRLPSFEEASANAERFAALRDGLVAEAITEIRRGTLRIGIDHLDGPNPPRRRRRQNREFGRDR